MTTYEFEVLMLGDVGVGKTSLVATYADGAFPDETQSTIAFDYKFKESTLSDGSHVKLKLVDTGGQERFRSMTQTYYANASGVVMLFDLTDRETFTNLGRWFEELNHYGPALDRILVGNKADLKDDRAVTTKEAEDWARVSGVPYVEVSVKEMSNLDDIFYTLGSNMKERIYNSQPTTTAANWQTTNLKTSTKKKKKDCIVM